MSGRIAGMRTPGTQQHSMTRRDSGESTHIYCAILVDSWGGAGQTGEEERQIIRQRVERALQGRTVRFTDLTTMPEDLDVDLLVFDYGGMQSHLYDFSRRVVRWIADHPSSLLVIGS